MCVFFKISFCRKIDFFALLKWCLYIQQIIKRQDLTWFLLAGSRYIHSNRAFLAVRWCSSKNPLHIWSLTLGEKLISICNFSLHLWIFIQVKQKKKVWRCWRDVWPKSHSCHNEKWALATPQGYVPDVCGCKSLSKDVCVWVDLFPLRSSAGSCWHDLTLR